MSESESEEGAQQPSTPEGGGSPERRQVVEALRSYGPLLGAAVIVLTFFDLGSRYGGFRIHNGPPFGYELPPVEIVFYVFFALFGTTCAVLVASGVRAFDLGAALTDRLVAITRSRWLLPGLCLFLFVEILLLKDFVLRETYVSDDEAVYVFIAKTLLGFDVKNAPPPNLDDHYRSTFVLLNQGGWYGKYPIGHPLLLALGEAVGARVIIVPLAAVASLCLTHRIARRLGGERKCCWLWCC